MSDLLDSRTDLDRVEGWFHPVDRAMFRWFLERQAAMNVTGDLVELGAYLGKSTIVLGDHLRESETFTVVDLFGAEPADLANTEENRRSYSTLTRQGFEANYLRFHSRLPVVHTGLSSEVTDLVAEDAARFLHVDASHLYEHVVQDIVSARRLLHEDGIVVFDDYRHWHTPGVAAAVWAAVATGGLRPICVTPAKLYATWGDPAPTTAALRAHLEESGETYVWSSQIVAGRSLIRVDVPAPTQTETIRRLRETLARKEAALTSARRRLRRRERQTAALRSSRSYRLGRALTAPARLFRR